MKCPSCNKIIKKTDKNCKFCGIEIENNIEKPIVKTQIIYRTVESTANKWLILIIGLLSFILILETSFNVWYFFVKAPLDDSKDKIKKYDYVLKFPFDIEKTNNSFEFDNLKIQVSNKYKIIKLDNQYSIYNGKNVIKIPVTITNNSNKNYSLNLFYYDIYDDYGNNIDEVAGYFEEALYYAEDLKENESYTKYIYALYYGNDSYTIKFENKEQTILIKYVINK